MGVGTGRRQIARTDGVERNRIMSIGLTTAAAGDTSAAVLHAGGAAPSVEFGPERICIRRRLAGVEALVNVPTASYRGVALRALGRAGPYEIALLHADPSLELVLARTADDTDLIALWRGYGRRLSLTLLVEDGDGRLRTVEAGAADRPFPRRRGAPLRHRRPRFLARRKTGQA